MDVNGDGEQDIAFYQKGIIYAYVKGGKSLKTGDKLKLPLGLIAKR